MYYVIYEHASGRYASHGMTMEQARSWIKNHRENTGDIFYYRITVFVE